MSNVTYVQVFSFGDAYTGVAVEAQAVDSANNALAVYSAAGIISKGGGQFSCAFTLPDGFRGVLCGRLVSSPAIIDVYPVNLTAAAIAPVVIGDALPAVNILIR